METFSALLAMFAWNSSVAGEFPAQRPVTRSFDVFFDLRLNKQRSKQSWGWWFETPPRPLWRHCNGNCEMSQRRGWTCHQSGLVQLGTQAYWQSTDPLLSINTVELDYGIMPKDDGMLPVGQRQIMMTSSNGNIFRVTGHLCGEFTGLRWIPRTKANDAELWYFLWSASE